MLILTDLLAQEHLDFYYLLIVRSMCTCKSYFFVKYFDVVFVMTREIGRYDF